MNDFINIKGVRGRLNANGDPELNLEDVARGWGFTQLAKSGNEVIRWERVRKYLEEFGIPTSGDDDDCESSGNEGLPEYIPENIVYKLGFKAKNEMAVTFQNLIADEVLPSLRKTGTYSVNMNATPIDPAMLTAVTGFIKARG